MFNFLMRFTNSGKISATTEEEQRACLEAVVLTLAGDRRLSMIEQWEFRQLIKRIRWRFNAKASRVRSEDGLLVHVFGRLTAACFLLLIRIDRALHVLERPMMMNPIRDPLQRCPQTFHCIDRHAFTHVFPPAVIDAMQRIIGRETGICMICIGIKPGRT